MHSPDQLRKAFTQFAEAYPIEGQPAMLYEAFHYMMSLGGKRMRPVLLQMAHQLYSDDLTAALPPALGIEFFHNFTLVHDDIMDRAPLRRGKPTVHERYDANTAILTGDVMMVFAYRLVADVPAAVQNQVTNIFNNTAIEVCEGQQYDLIFEKEEAVSVADYLKMIEMKTAALLAGCLQMGACIGGAGPEDRENLDRFGRQMGICFQLMDDLLDSYGDSGKFGKQIGGDILCNKKTFLLLQALELAGVPQRNQLRQWLQNDTNDIEKVKAVRQIFDDLNIRSHTETAVRHYHRQALAYLERVNAPADRKALLKDFAEGLLQRQR